MYDSSDYGLNAIFFFSTVRKGEKKVLPAPQTRMKYKLAAWQGMKGRLTGMGTAEGTRNIRAA